MKPYELLFDVIPRYGNLLAFVTFANSLARAAKSESEMFTVPTALGGFVSAPRSLITVTSPKAYPQSQRQ